MELPFMTIAVAPLLFISFIVGLIRGVKRSFYSLIANLASVLLAFGITKLAIIILSRGDVLTNVGSSVIGVFHEVLTTSGLVLTPKFLGTIIVSLCILYAVYLLMLIISEPIKRAIFNKATKVEYSKYKVLLEKKWYMKILAVIISMASCVVTCYLLTFAVTASINAVHDGFSDEHSPQEIIVIDQMNSDPIKVVGDKCFSKQVFNFITAMQDKNVKTVTTNEITQAIRLVIALNDIDTLSRYDETNSTDPVEKFNKYADTIETALTSTEIVPEIAARVIVDIANENDPGELDKEGKTFDARLKKLQNELLILMKSSNKDNIKENVKTFSAIGKELFKKELVYVNSYKDVEEALKDEELTETILVELYENKNTQNVMSALIDLCVGSVFDNIKSDVKQTYIFSMDYDKLSVKEIKNEAKIISLLAKDYELIQKISNNEVLTPEELTTIKEDLEKIKECEIVTSTVYDTIRGFVRNQEVPVVPEAVEPVATVNP